LNDGEIEWGEYSPDVLIIFESKTEEPKPLVITREYGEGKVVWLSSGDFRENPPKSVSLHTKAGNRYKLENPLALAMGSCQTFAIDSEQKSFFIQLLFSYKINPRTVLFLGYSENYFGDQGIRLTQSDRTFFLKLGYAWVL